MTYAPGWTRALAHLIPDWTDAPTACFAGQNEDRDMTGFPRVELKLSRDPKEIAAKAMCRQFSGGQCPCNADHRLCVAPTVYAAEAGAVVAAFSAFGFLREPAS